MQLALFLVIIGISFFAAVCSLVYEIDFIMEAVIFFYVLLLIACPITYYSSYKPLMKTGVDITNFVTLKDSDNLVAIPSSVKETVTDTLGISKDNYFSSKYDKLQYKGETGLFLNTFLTWQDDYKQGIKNGDYKIVRNTVTKEYPKGTLKCFTLHHPQSSATWKYLYDKNLDIYYPVDDDFVFSKKVNYTVYYDKTSRDTDDVYKTDSSKPYSIVVYKATVKSK